MKNKVKRDNKIKSTINDLDTQKITLASTYVLYPLSVM